MKYKLFILSILVVNSFSFGQIPVQKIKRENFIGQKVKFLRDNENIHGYRSFGKNPETYPWLSYQEFKERTATFLKKEGNLFIMKMDDNSELIYFKHYDFSDVPNNIGFFSLLDSARKKYLDKTFYKPDLEQCRIIAIEFAEDDGEYSQLFGPYNIFYKVKADTFMVNMHFSETYGPKDGYTYAFQKERVFENAFKLQKPLKATNISLNPQSTTFVPPSDTSLFIARINKDMYLSDNLNDYGALGKTLHKEGDIIFLYNFYSNYFK